jgi:hypothetical protein
MIKEPMTTKDDQAALKLAVELMLKDPDMVDHVLDMIDECGLEKRGALLKVGKFCSYYQQTSRLELEPWVSPPCWIYTREAAEAILTKGNLYNCASARLLLDMLDAGVSAFHPDPVGAIAEAKQAKRSR